MNCWRLAAVVLPGVLACTTLVPGTERSDAGGTPLVSPPGFFHLPHPTMARTLFLQPDGVVRMWLEECDSLGRGEATWSTTDAGIVEIVDGAGTHTMTLRDGGTLLIDPPLLGAGGAPPELWLGGAVCSVCYPGWPIAVVRCTTPDAGLVSPCCASDCGGATPTPVSCTLALRAGGEGSPNAVAAGTCTCQPGSVRAADCGDSPAVFCGGPALRPGDGCCAGGCNGDVLLPVACDGGACACPAGSVSPGDCSGDARPYCGGDQPDAGH